MPPFQQLLAALVVILLVLVLEAAKENLLLPSCEVFQETQFFDNAYKPDLRNCSEEYELGSSRWGKICIYTTTIIRAGRVWKKPIPAPRPVLLGFNICKHVS